MDEDDHKTERELYLNGEPPEKNDDDADDDDDGDDDGGNNQHADYLSCFVYPGSAISIKILIPICDKVIITKQNYFCDMTAKCCKMILLNCKLFTFPGANCAFIFLSYVFNCTLL